MPLCDAEHISTRLHLSCCGMTEAAGVISFADPDDDVFNGYYKDPELTAASFDEDGWFHTGDLMVLDAQGRLTFVSGLKDMLKVGGENVAAAEVEGYLLGQRGGADRLLPGRIASYRVPRYVRFVEDYPIYPEPR